MSQFVFLRGARQLITLRGPTGIRRGAAMRDLAIIPDGSILLENGRIVSIGSTRRLENLKEARAALEIPVEGKIILPGLVDPGLHLTTFRATPAGPRQKRTAEFYDETLTLLRSCLQHGTVATRAHAAADNMDPRADLAVLRSLAKVGENPVRLCRSWRLTPAPEGGEFHDGLNLESAIETLLKRNLANWLTISESSAQTLHLPAGRMLRHSKLPIHLLWAGRTPDQLLNLLAETRPRTVSPARPLTQWEADCLEPCGSTIILSTGKPLLEHNRYSVVRNLIDRGAPVALSSGYHPSETPMFSMQMAIALAVARFGLTPEEAITAATVNAACAIGYEGLLGTLEVGKTADLVVLNLPDLRDLPEQFGTNHVAMVFRNGQIVFNRTRWRAPVVQSPDRVRSKLL